MTTITGKIIKIVPIQEYFSITWAITNKCNYDCMYCSPEFHNPTSKNFTLEELQSHWLKVYEKTSHLGMQYKISITGGEATTSKFLIPFLAWLRKEYTQHIGMILLTTNGSASASYYKKIFAVVDNITLTVHSEHIDETLFFNKVKELKIVSLKRKKILHVDIMDEVWNHDRIPYYVEILEKFKVPHSINVIDYKYKTRDYPIMKGKLNLDIPDS